MGLFDSTGVGRALFPGRHILSNEEARRSEWQGQIDKYMGTVKPFNVSTALGDLQWDQEGNTYRWTPNASVGRIANLLSGEQAAGRLENLLGGGGMDFTSGVLNQMRDLASPYEQRTREELEAKLLRQGLLTSDTGGYQTQALNTALSEADQKRMLEAYGLREKLLSGEVGRVGVGQQMQLPPEIVSKLGIAGLSSRADMAKTAMAMYQNEQNARRSWDTNLNENAKDAWSMIMAGFGMNIGSGRSGGGVNSSSYDSDTGAFGSNNTNYWGDSTGTGQNSWADMGNVYSNGGTASGSNTGWGVSGFGEGGSSMFSDGGGLFSGGGY